MATMSVGGLASGLDTNSIIEQLTALEQAKVTREEQKKTSAQSTLDKFKELETRLGNLQQKAKGLELPKDFNVFKANSNNEEYATISGGEGATAGNYELVVHQLATTQKVASNAFGAINKPISDYLTGTNNFSSDGTTTISLSTSAITQKGDPKKTTVDVKINSSDTLKDIVNKINAAEGAGVKASLMTMANGDNRIVLTAVDTGTNGFFLKENGGTNLLSSLGIIDNDTTTQKATSGNALTVLDGGAATEETTFDKLNTVLNKNNLNSGDVIGIKLPANNGSGNAGWVTFDLFDSSGKAKKIGDVLKEINNALSSSGANFEAKLNSSGEIVLEGELDIDKNFGNGGISGATSNLKNVEIKIGTFTQSNQTTMNGVYYTEDEDGNPIAHAYTYTLSDEDGKFESVKKDMGSLTTRNIFTNVITEGQNAFYTLDGMSITSQSNDDDKTIVGTTFSLKKADKDKVVKLSLEPDMGAVADKISAFVEEYNALLKFIDENTKATIKEETDKTTGKKTNTRVVGAFTGDSGISSLRDELRNMFSGIIRELSNPATIDGAPNDKYSGFYTTYSSAARIGIITNKEGVYEVDKEKLTKALNADFEGVRKLFTTGGWSDTNGFAVGRAGKDSQVGTYTYVNDPINNIQMWTLNGKEVEGTWSANNLFTTKDGLNFELPDGFVGTAKVTFVRGIAGQITNWVEKANTGYWSDAQGKFVDGYFKASKTKYQNRIDEIDKRIDLLQRRVDNYNARLVSQFSALERSMSNLQSQTSNMMSALSGGK